MLSHRASQWKAGRAPLVEAHFKCLENAFHPQRNPNGHINLGTAENHLLWPLLSEKFSDIPDFPEKTVHYDVLYGSLPLREATARYLTHYTQASPAIQPENLVIAAGASAVLDMLAQVLCDPGDAILIPAPYYSGFDVDFQLRASVKLIPIPLSSANHFALSLPDISQAYEQASQRGDRIKALLINSPNNPLGQLYSSSLLQEILTFCDGHQIACIVDEIYLNSVYGQSAFTSILALAGNRQNVHYIYGFAKDFGLSGFKTGVYYSLNNEAITAMRQLCYFSPVSTHTQFVLTRLLQDEAWIQTLIAGNFERLGQAYAFASQALSDLGINFCEAEAGIFLLVDLRHWLKAQSFEAEQELWQDLFSRCGLNFSPGQLFHVAEPGWFRFCFAHPMPVLQEVVKRLAQYSA